MQKVAIYFLTAKNTIRRIAKRNSRFSTRINGMYWDNFEGSATGRSGGFAIGGRVVLGGAHGCMV
jgi:hypothetical protein